MAVAFSMAFSRVPAWAMLPEEEEAPYGVDFEDHTEGPIPVEDAVVAAKPAATVSSSSPAGPQNLKSQRVGSSRSGISLRKSWYWYLRGKK